MLFQSLSHVWFSFLKSVAIHWYTKSIGSRQIQTPLLEKDAEFFTLDDNLDYPPLEIQGAYPDVASFASLYSRYTQQAEANIGVIIVNLYTSADKETVLVAEIQVNYLAKP